MLYYYTTVYYHQMLSFLAVALGLLALLYQRRAPATLTAILWAFALAIVGAEIPHIREIGIWNTGSMLFAGVLGTLTVVCISQIGHWLNPARPPSALSDAHQQRSNLETAD